MRLQELDFFVQDRGTSINVHDCPPGRFWREWNDGLYSTEWHRIELDRDGNPYTIKWWTMAYQSNGAGWIVMTHALVAEGSHPVRTATATKAEAPARKSGTTGPKPSATQPAGQLADGARLRNPAGTWTVEHYRQVSTDCGEYLLTHEDGHRETWKARDMVAADFHLILPDEQQTLI
ncbi:hypothetical protein ACFV4E_23000 [Streptomyces hygroscopicus]|uniref:hypothetical protein n=1 Tax=Streptomyces hygroscopicus TaxID=1912 RepID=UPI0036AC453E